MGLSLRLFPHSGTADWPAAVFWFSFHFCPLTWRYSGQKWRHKGGVPLWQRESSMVIHHKTDTFNSYPGWKEHFYWNYCNTEEVNEYAAIGRAWARPPNKDERANVCPASNAAVMDRRHLWIYTETCNGPGNMEAGCGIHPARCVKMPI